MNYSADSFKSFNPTGEIIMALIVIGVLIVLFIIIGILAKTADPLKRPKGLLLLAEWGNLMDLLRIRWARDLKILEVYS